MYPERIFKPVGETYKKTITNTITSLPTIPPEAMRCKIQVESQDIRVKFNNTNSTTYGVTAGIGGGFILFVSTVANPYYIVEPYDAMTRMRMYRSGSTDSFINVMFEGEAQPDSGLTGTYSGGLA